MIRTAILILTFALSGPAQAQQTRSLAPGASSPKAAIEDVAWLAGHWEGEGLGGRSIETISPPAGGQMVGHFQQLEDGKVQFYELYEIAPKDGSLVMRIKHFNADLTGWEEKDKSMVFPLVAVETNAVHFDGLTIRRDGDRMESIVRIGEGEGKSEEATFRFRKVPN